MMGNEDDFQSHCIRDLNRKILHLLETSRSREVESILKTQLKDGKLNQIPIGTFTTFFKSIGHSAASSQVYECIKR